MAVTRKLHHVIADYLLQVPVDFLIVLCNQPTSYAALEIRKLKLRRTCYCERDNKWYKMFFKTANFMILNLKAINFNFIYYNTIDVSALCSTFSTGLRSQGSLSLSVESLPCSHIQQTFKHGRKRRICESYPLCLNILNKKKEHLSYLEKDATLGRNYPFSLRLVVVHRHTSCVNN